MLIKYKKSIEMQMHRAIVEAKNNNIEIEEILLSPKEYHEFMQIISRFIVEARPLVDLAKGVEWMGIPIKENRYI